MLGANHWMQSHLIQISGILYDCMIPLLDGLQMCHHSIC